MEMLYIMKNIWLKYKIKYKILNSHITYNSDVQKITKFLKKSANFYKQNLKNTYSNMMARQMTKNELRQSTRTQYFSGIKCFH